MKTFELKGAVRNELGKKASKRYRKEGAIPCILYGSEGVTHFSVSHDSVRKLIYTPEVYIIDLDVDGKKCMAILKDMQFHPVSDETLHLDFLHISDKKPISMKIPVVLQGLAEGVRAGGKLSLEMKKMTVKGLYTDFPENLAVNIENLQLGKTIQVGELAFDKVELLDAKANVVCAVKLTRAARGLAAKTGK
ncbi:50S ribosomal protein L25 [Bacteroidales bacterium]|nr:50S ribosomal protein L25 [Bacteroidales bacterium]